MKHVAPPVKPKKPEQPTHRELVTVDIQMQIHIALPRAMSEVEVRDLVYGNLARITRDCKTKAEKIRWNQRHIEVLELIDEEWCRHRVRLEVVGVEEQELPEVEILEVPKPTRRWRDN